MAITRLAEAVLSSNPHSLPKPPPSQSQMQNMPDWMSVASSSVETPSKKRKTAPTQTPKNVELTDETPTTLQNTVDFTTVIDEYQRLLQWQTSMRSIFEKSPDLAEWVAVAFQWAKTPSEREWWQATKEERVQAIPRKNGRSFPHPP